MKTLKEYIIAAAISTTLYEASILSDIEDTISSGEHDLILHIITKGDVNSRKEFRDSLYNEILKTSKRIKRKSTIKEDTLYIQFLKGDNYDYWGFRIGTCNKNEKNIIVTMINCLHMASIVDDNKSEALRLDAYLKYPLFELPRDWEWLYYELKEKLEK